MGMRVGPYVVTETLGEGTFGKVRLATHSKTGAEVAIKLLDKSAIRANELTHNVRREIAIMKALEHQNIVNLREVLSSRSKLYIVMDLVRGGELFDQIERNGELDTATARSYFQQLIDGVYYCHQRGVFHRDLKPENLLVDQDGTLKITDFGVSSMSSTPGTSDLLYTACGTPFYCAPEIINGAESGYSGAKVDAWSCGIILYLLLTGNLPFQHDDMSALYELIDNCNVEFPQWMDQDAKHLIANLLVKDPAKRFSLDQVKQHPWFLVDYDPVDGGAAARSAKAAALSASKIKAAQDTAIIPTPSPAQTQQQIDNSNSLPSDNESSQDTSNTQLPVLQLAEVAPLATSPAPTSTLPLDLPDLSAPAPITSPSTPTPTRRAPPTPEYRAPQFEMIEATSPKSIQLQPSPTSLAPASPKPPLPPVTVPRHSSTSGGSVRDVTVYKGGELTVLIRDALPGKSNQRVAKVVDLLAEIDVECVEDMAFLSATLKDATKLSEWLEEKGTIPKLTCMRLAAFFYL